MLDGKWSFTVEGVFMNGNIMIPKLVLIKERVGECMAKPQSLLIDEKNIGLPTGLTSVCCCASFDRHILFPITLVGIVWGNITNPSSIRKGHKITCNHTSMISMRIKFTMRKDRINMNRQKKQRTNKNQGQNNNELTGGPQANNE